MGGLNQRDVSPCMFYAKKFDDSPLARHCFVARITIGRVGKLSVKRLNGKSQLLLPLITALHSHQLGLNCTANSAPPLFSFRKDNAYAFYVITALFSQIYRVTHLVDSNLLLTSNQKFRFCLARSEQTRLIRSLSYDFNGKFELRRCVTLYKVWSIRKHMLLQLIF